MEGDFELEMSSPTLDRIVFAAAPITSTNPQTRPVKSVEPGADTALATRALVAVTLFGAGIWYLLWKLALYFESGR